MKNRQLTGHQNLIHGFPVEKIEKIIEPFCSYMFQKLLNYESIPPEYELLQNYICTHSTKEIAENMSGMAIYWKNEYSVQIYNLAIEFNKGSKPC